MSEPVSISCAMPAPAPGTHQMNTILRVMAAREPVKTSDLFVRCLEEEGIEFVFGVRRAVNCTRAVTQSRTGVSPKFGSMMLRQVSLLPPHRQVPGEENADFMMSLEKSSTIRFVLTRHEQGAAFMAEIYGRLTGQVTSTLGQYCNLSIAPVPPPPPPPRR